MNKHHARRWFFVVVYAAAMAWVEAAVVFYLRKMVYRIEPYQATPLPEFGGIAPAEMIREFATLIMLLTVGWLAGQTRRARLGYCLLAFGVWDILYYVFLKVLTGWPRGVFDWDLLFLLPLPWWGPVLAPICIAVLMILWGTAVTQFEWSQPAPADSRRAWTLAALGTATALYVFMADAIRVVDQGGVAIRNVLPQQFNWPLFLVALALMAAPVVEVWRRIRASATGALPAPQCN